MLCFNKLIAQNNHPGNYPTTRPDFQVDKPYPTTDKPQSKLFYMYGCWWAVLPKTAGPSLWQRTPNGWIEHTEIAKVLKGIPGRADIWPNNNQITAVAVDTNKLVVFRLNASQNKSGIKWTAAILATLILPNATGEIETATIARDGKGHWWVAAAVDKQVCVWNAPKDGKRWTKSFIIADGIKDDDICMITELPGGVGVVWSDQVRETVSMRVHKDGQPSEKWGDIITIEAGNKTADDHLNAALSTNGTLWIATKNSVDKNEEPQFVLRVRELNGTWKNFSYAPVTTIKQPTRPIVIATADPSIVLSGHTVSDTRNSFLGEIVFGRVDTSLAGILKNVRTVIAPDTTGWLKGNRVNDVTGPKKPFPMNVPWIVLASDKEGRVYEADLRGIVDSAQLR